MIFFLLVKKNLAYLECERGLSLLEGRVPAGPVLLTSGQLVVSLQLDGAASLAGLGGSSSLRFLRTAKVRPLRLS